MAELLLPGFGGAKDDSFTIVEGGSAAYSTELDASQCGNFAHQLISTGTLNSVLTVQAQQTMAAPSGSTEQWADYGASQAATAGTLLRFPQTSAPFGKVRFKYTLAANAGATKTLVTRTVGWSVAV